MVINGFRSLSRYNIEYEVITISVLNNIDFKGVEQLITMDEVGIARIIAKSLKKTCFFAHQIALWYVKEDNILIPDPSARLVNRYVIEFSDCLLKRAKSETNEAKKHVLELVACELRSLKRRLKIITQASHELSISFYDLIKASRLPYFNCIDVIVNLESGNELQFDPAVDLLNKTFIEFNTNAICPELYNNINKAFGGITELVNFFQKICGLMIAGYTLHRKIFMIRCPPGFFLINLMKLAFGNYLVVLNYDVFTKKIDGHELFDLHSARVLLIDGAPKGTKFNHLLTQILVGNPVKAKYGKHELMIQPNCIILIASEHLVTFADADIVNNSVVSIVLDKDFITSGISKVDNEMMKSPQCLSAFLNFALEGFEKVKANNGLSIPESITADTTEYENASDIFESFMRETFEPTSSNYKLRTSKGYELFKDWCNSNDLWSEIKGSRHFHKQLFEKKVRVSRVNGPNYMRGYKIRCQNYNTDILDDDDIVPASSLDDDARKHYDTVAVIYEGEKPEQALNSDASKMRNLLDKKRTEVRIKNVVTSLTKRNGIDYTDVESITVKLKSRTSSEGSELSKNDYSSPDATKNDNGQFKEPKSDMPVDEHNGDDLDWIMSDCEDGASDGGGFINEVIEGEDDAFDETDLPDPTQGLSKSH